MGTFPLGDVTVVSLEQAVAAPLATRQLADLGARVIKVERPAGGDFARGYDETVLGQSSVFVWLNRGKQSVRIDLKSEHGLRAVDKLLARADVFVANLAPRVLETLRLDIRRVQERHPHLIACVISGYAPDGPTPHKKAYDALIQAETGLMSLTGLPGAPAKAGISIADIAAGSYAFSGVLAALRHRDRTGEALPVQVSLFDALTEWMAYPLYYTSYGGQAPRPMGTAHPTIAPYGAVRTADGATLMIAVQNEREWQRLCGDVLSIPDLAADERFTSNSRRAAHRDKLDDELAGAFGKLTETEAAARLDEAQIAWSRINDVTGLATHPELRRPNRWIDTWTPAGGVRTLVPPALPGGRLALGEVPALGEHDAEVMADLAEGEEG